MVACDFNTAFESQLMTDTIFKLSAYYCINCLVHLSLSLTFHACHYNVSNDIIYTIYWLTSYKYDVYMQQLARIGGFPLGTEVR